MLGNIKQMLGNFGNLKELQKTFTDFQSKLKAERLEGNAGGGLVKVIVDGTQEVVEVSIEKELVNIKDKKLLEDLIKSATNQALEKASAASQKLAMNLLHENKGILDTKEGK